MSAYFPRFIPHKAGYMAAFMVFMGALAALALPPVHAVFVLPVSFWAYYQAASSAPDWRKAALWGFLFGMGFHIAGLYWLTNAILTRIHEFWWIVPFATPGVALVIAPLMAVPAVLCRLVPPGWARIAVFAGCWTIADMSRSWFFSGFPWNPLGSALEFYGTPGDIAIQPASLIGVDGLSLVLLLASLALWQRRWGVLGVMMTSCLWCGFGMWRLHHPRLRPVHNPDIVLVQGNVAESEILDHQEALNRFEFYRQATSRGIERAVARKMKGPFVVLWPESAFPGILDENPRARDLIAEAAEGATVFVGSPRRENGPEGERWYNSLQAIASDGKIIARYDKSRLVPFGEYQPAILPFNLVPFVFTPGPGLQTWQSHAFGRVGPMICYEVIFSGAVTDRNNRPDWLLAISNDAWYGNSAGPRQHLATGRMRAVEEGLPLVFANNRGISAVYDAYGHELARTEWGREQSLILALPAPAEPGLFARWGRVIGFSLSVLCLISGLVCGSIRRIGKKRICFFTNCKLFSH